MFDKLRLLKLTMTLLMLMAAPFNALAESVKYEFAESPGSTIRAEPNQTLSMLVQQMYPNEQKIWSKLEQEIRNRNPHAFDSYTRKIIPGQRIKLVTIKIIRQSRLLTRNIVGEVHSLNGNVIATDSKGNKRRLVAQASVHEGDRLTTEPGSSVIVKMIDDAEIHLMQNSSLRITEYKMKSGFETGSRSILDLIKGGLKTLTGKIGANPLSVYRFQTGLVTIGVKGTEYVVKFCEIDNCNKSSGRNDANARLHVVVLDGLISLQDEEGAVGELMMGQYAVATSEIKAMVNDAPPVNGLLTENEQKKFNEIKLKLKGESKSIWPWQLSGAF